MKLEDIENEWAQDCKIDRSDLTEESLKIPELHNKYYKIYIKEKVQNKKLETDLDTLIKSKREYYNGELSEEELKEYGWEQFDLTVLKKDIDYYINADPDIIKSKLSLALQSEKVQFLYSILHSLNSRSFNIKNAIEFLKFTNGVM
jgi:hypothetical protein